MSMSADGGKDKTIENMDPKKTSEAVAKESDDTEAAEVLEIPQPANTVGEDTCDFGASAATANSNDKVSRKMSKDAAATSSDADIIEECEKGNETPQPIKNSAKEAKVHPDKDNDKEVKSHMESDSTDKRKSPESGAKKLNDSTDVSLCNPEIAGTDKSLKKSEPKTKNGKLDKSDTEVDDYENAVMDKNNEVGEDDENVVALAEIDRINDNINKTRVDGLQTLHVLCFGAQGKNNVVKKNLRSFAGFEFSNDSGEYRKKLEAIKKIDNKGLRSICEILVLDRRGSKEAIAARIIKFLMEPDESLCDVEEDQEELEEESEDEDEFERKSKISSGGACRNSSRNFSGRPRRSTAGKKMSAYVDFSSSEESDHKVAVPKRRRHDDSESGSDYNPSANSDSDAGQGGASGLRHSVRSGSGRLARKSRKNSDSEDVDESELSDAESDKPKRKRIAPPKRGRPPVAAVSSRRGRGRIAAAQKRKNSESEISEISEEEVSEFASEQSEDEHPKKTKRHTTPAKNRKTNKSKSFGKGISRPKHSKKELIDDEESDEDEPLNKKGKLAFPTDEQIRNYVKEILDEANLEEITMKTVCKQVYAKYPDFDLTEKKDFIKATVKALIAA
ncbi:protein DEK isoform X2 [Scaptodrosophila lebanonensis]|uniref:Protein DEK n=1 Tax=Drosophila lebanonensis TaxID=7225 RepID=A0A6J2TI41_DROLE|nr:protein DEK isoform X2 [Scaptodrosophila lebanonensis]